MKATPLKLAPFSVILRNISWQVVVGGKGAIVDAEKAYTPKKKGAINLQECYIYWC